MFRKLKTLVCKGVKVTEIPDWIGEMTNLTNIDLSCNKLTDISKLYRLSKLEKLDVSSNQIKDLDLGMFKSIKSINAFNNKITRIRNASDSKLVYLNLDRNDVKCADSLIENDTLEILNLSNNTDLEINSKSIGKSLNKLLLVNCSLTTIPEFVDSNINELAIETIDLSFNCFDDNYIESTKVIFKTNSDEDVFIILK